MAKMTHCVGIKGPKVQITLSLAAQRFKKWTWLCKDTFFSPEMPEEEVKRYIHTPLSPSSRMTFPFHQVCGIPLLVKSRNMRLKSCPA